MSELRGGLRGRNLGQMVATPLLWVERCLNPAPHGTSPHLMHALSLDAYKCFDRITYSSVIQAS